MSVEELLYGWLHVLRGDGDQIESCGILVSDSQSALDGIQLEPVRTSGFSGARIWKVTDTSGSEWCLRCWPANGPSREKLEWIHSQIFTATACGITFLSVPVPARPFGKSVVERDGLFWELSPWLRGVPVLTKGCDPSAMERAILATNELHAAFQQGFRMAYRLDDRKAKSAGIEKRFLRLRQAASLLVQIRSAVETGSSEIDRRLIHDSISAIETCSERLSPVAQRLVNQKFQVQPVLTDLWCEHVLFENGMVTGVIDYGSLALDIPELAFARLVGSVEMLFGLSNSDRGGEQPAFEGWRNLQDAANASPGKILLDHGILEFLHQTNVILGCLNWLEWIFVQYRNFADPDRAMDRARQMMRAAIAMAART